ncbi:MAG: bifunctional DNA-formamidopyrimidine glycosylase/DNA-(apurinic or apyrimidinic site) lyase [Gammaproteobacteria bacterium]|nr:bifunctional DNA-formamidopyrimidine glycosylase/DNA-(apurinic or apyrimidinic site) lyase [Gammaproteobacteria bacterium]MDD9897225.1 bifunctional DNA-formamidopyrimidine glycosylase/DNA-(apurinic or apyrimidinic site) lyase [Gammaproteobacteria bacterium]MDD9959166.1 bifunctional DNA-formamidopyrimidine glycosylase/DNA-(apurinic or apyrimidinic site) lyase [Gammaproteobacteria bacterium]
MPELPEVETTRNGIYPHIKNKRVEEVIVRQKKLRWEIPDTLPAELPGHSFNHIDRRGKYLLLHSKKGILIIHLGMSGSLRIVAQDSPAGKHDHVDIVLQGGKVLRYTDPRRFGCMLWEQAPVESHPLLIKLGPEPLTKDFDYKHLFKVSRGRSAAVKTFIMDSKVVVGVGNIYANEALFMAGINPKRAAGKISKQTYVSLVHCIKEILQKSISVGGTTLRDFTNSGGEPGYFKQALSVYGRGGENCLKCNRVLKEIRLGQRSTVYCTQCQR